MSSMLEQICEYARQVMASEQVCDCGRDAHVDRMLRLLALPYADHDDYREDWRP